MRTRKALSIAVGLPRFHTNFFYAAKSLVEAGHRVHLICDNQDGIEDYSTVEPILPSDTSFRGMGALLDELAPDLLILREFHEAQRNLFWAARLRRIRTVAYDQRPYFSQRSGRELASSYFIGPPLKRMTPVLGLDQDRPADRHAAYIPFPVDHCALGERVYAPNGTVRVLCVGKLAQERKNHHGLIAALANLLPGANFSLTLVGASHLSITGGSRAYRETLYDEMQRGPLRGRMEVIADAAFRDMKRIFMAHDICVLPSFRESFGSAPIEAMVYGCVPVVSSEAGSAGLLRETMSQLIINPEDTDALSSVLGTLISKPELLSYFGLLARKLVSRELTAEKFVRRIQRLSESRWLA